MSIQNAQRYKAIAENYGDRYSSYKVVLHRDKKGSLIKHHDHVKVLTELIGVLKSVARSDSTDNLCWCHVTPTVFRGMGTHSTCLAVREALGEDQLLSKSDQLDIMERSLKRVTYLVRGLRAETAVQSELIKNYNEDLDVAKARIKELEAKIAGKK